MKVLLERFGIFVRGTDSLLEIGNEFFRRTFDLSSGAPRTISLTGPDGREWARADSGLPDFDFAGFRSAALTQWTFRDLRCSWRAKTLFDGAHAEIRLRMIEDVSRTEYVRLYRVYPELAALSVQTSLRSAVYPNRYGSFRGLPGAAEPVYCAMDRWMPKRTFSRRSAVEFFGRTDYTDTVVQRRVWDLSSEGIRGNILDCADSHGRGFRYLQEAPPSSESRECAPFDFRKEVSGELSSEGWGIAPGDFHPGEMLSGNRHVLFFFMNGCEKDCLLHDYLKRRFPPPEKSRGIMVNPWGCGCFSSLMSADFLGKEIAAAPSSGGECYQIDDSWQEGGSLREFEVSDRAAGMDFWEISRARLNGTFHPQKEAAVRAGIDLGLWLAPSFNCEYADWREFAARILELHREYGFSLFKIDGVKIRSLKAEKNLEHLLRTVRARTNGAVYFNLDATSGQRPGFFLFQEYGNIFLENRYVCHPWGLGYHPEKTLRNLWTLSEFIRPQSLQIEIPSPADCVEEYLQGKPDPRGYPVEYWAAIALFANPLLWFAPSRTPLSVREKIRSVMDLHRAIREDLFSGEIYPAGDMPSGRSFTGFVSVNTDGGGYAVFYREKDAAGEEISMELPHLPGLRDWTFLGGCAGSVCKSAADGTALLRIPAAPGFALFSHRVKERLQK